MVMNMIERLRELAQTRAGDLALVTVDSSGDTRYDYAALDARACGIAAYLQALDATGERALLLMDSGVDYVSAFFGSLYAGTIAVPAYPPESLRSQHMARLESIAKDADVRYILTTSALAQTHAQAFAAIAPAAQVIAVDALNSRDTSAFKPCAPASDDIAFLQYTSGSTSMPKGVMVTHANLWANEVVIKEGLGVGADDVFVSWLPLYHDMGLIGSMSQPVFSGIPLVLMSPQYFLERPVRWLEAIARHRGTISGGPDFSYRLCTDRVRDEQRAKLDLASWRVAFSGSEPVRKSTLDAFVDRFEGVGFDAQALFPCYGLAEATLFVSGVARGAGVYAPSFAVDALEASRAVPDMAGTPLVSCGQSASGHTIEIVDTASGLHSEDGSIGEIQVSGPSVAAGYWRRPDDTAQTFVERDNRRWLKTGDLGFIADGSLYVAGRLKDLLIVRGRNLYPQDIEQAIEREVELVRRGRVAAFAVECDGQEGIGIAAEVSRNMQKVASAEAISAALTEAVALACGEAPAAVVLLNPGGLPKTSSGKVQRAACAKNWQARSLDAFAFFQQGRRLDAVTLPAATGGAPQGVVEPALVGIWRDVLQVDTITRHDSFFALGGNSLAAVQIAAKVSAKWNVVYAVRDVFTASTFKDAAALIESLSESQDNGKVVKSTPPIVRLPNIERRVTRVSFAQRSLWLAWQEAPASAAYNMSGELRLQGVLNVDALRHALDDLVRTHDILRVRFELNEEGEPVQIADDTWTLELAETGLRGTPAADREDALRVFSTTFANEPFDLERGSLMRANLLRMDEHEHRLLLALHHIVADGWSVNLLIDTLGASYQRHAGSDSKAVAESVIQYIDYASWERTTLDSQALEQQLGYWRKHLAGDSDPRAAARLFDRPRDVAAGRQRTVKFVLPTALGAKLKACAADRRASLFMVMLAVFNATLHRLTGKTDVRIGAPVSNRTRPEMRNVVGYFINVQVLRTRVAADNSFVDLIDAARETVFAAHDHLDVPFDVLVSALLPNRSRDDRLFQLKLTEQRPFSTHAFQPLESRLTVISNEAAHFDLALDFTPNEKDDAIACLLAYDDAVFDGAFAIALADAFTTMAQALADTPFKPLAEFLPGDNAGSTRAEKGECHDFPANNVRTLWDASVEQHGQRIALFDGPRSMTFAELDAAANALACTLQTLGAGPEIRVGVYAPRSAEQVLGMLAALKCGATYVPFDPQMPAARIAAQAAASRCAVMLYQGELPEELHDVAPVILRMNIDSDVFASDGEHPFFVPLLPDHAAYVIFTSGSTGQPKGVVVTHGALANYVQGMLTNVALANEASFAMVSTPAADLGCTALFGALCYARTLHLISPECAFNPDCFAQYMSVHRVGALKIVPSHLSALLTAGQAADVLPSDVLIVGGEAASPELLDRIAQLRPSLRVFNHYGPTETTIGIAMHAWRQRVPDEAGLPLGKPLPNTRIYVLDDAINRVPDGVAGELYLGGPGLARGYDRRPGATAQRFVPDPFVPGERVYRSGDRARLTSDGVLQYLGRSDDQVKIRGYRVEIAEVERAVRAIRGVDDAAIVAHDVAGNKRLAAFVVTLRGEDDVLATLAGVLPDYMIPARVVAMSALPLTANGKLDRNAFKALLAGLEQRPDTVTDDTKPRGDVEIALATIWSEVLARDLDSICREKNFFEAGGDSIMGLKVVAKARKAGLKLTPKQLFERQTLAELAACALPSGKGVTRSNAMHRLPDSTRSRSLASCAQQRQWFLWQLSPDSSAYHVAGAVRLQGRVDRAALHASFEAIVSRHEVLRTRFVADDDGRVEQIIDATGALDWRESSVTLESVEETARALAAEPFDLNHGPLLRVGLFSLGEQEHRLVLAMHHIVSDGWSVQVLLDELVAQYRSRVLDEAVALAPLPVQYADYAAWQRDWLEAGERERQLDYWRKTLGDEHPVLALPTDAPRPAHAEYRASRYRVSVPSTLTQAVRERAQQSAATPFMVLLAAFHALLYRYTGQKDVRTGVPIANRHRVETEGLIGFFVNTQVLRSEIDSGTTLNGLIEHVRQQALGAQAHQDLPFDVLVDALRPERSLAHSPLFQVMFNHQRRDWRALQRLPGLTIEAQALPNEMAQFELMLDTREEEDGALSLNFTYARELFEEHTIERMALHYQALLRAFTQADVQTTIGEVALLDHAERDEITRWSRNETTLANLRPVHRDFEQHAAGHPEDIALLFGDERLTYAELNTRSNQLAHWLAKQGVGVESKVGVAAERSLEMVIALMGIMKAGAAYVPLDPSYPADRLAYMIEDSGIVLLLTQSGVSLPDAPVPRISLDQLDLSREATHDPEIKLNAANLAYVIYTSGSTGRPKGVGNRHDALSNRLRWMQHAYGLQRGETVLQKTPFSFDVSVWEFFWPLMVGARLAVAAPGEHRDPARLIASINRYAVSTLHFVPSMLQAFIASGDVRHKAQTLKRIVCSGEALPADLQEKVFESLPEVELHNLYGPTEAAIDVTAWACRREAGRAVPIGAPIADTQTYVLDERMELVPRGVAGELYLGGAGLARGYLGRAALTAERFMPDGVSREAKPGARLYRTGDLVRWCADGVLDYLGRIDHQVKIRGFRIELGEIESQLVALDEVREAVVVAHEGKLVGYVTVNSTAQTEGQQLRAALARSVPDYMVPWQIMVIGEMPLNANGKIDRKALPVPHADTIRTGHDYEAPQGATEIQLASIWSQLLNVQKIGRHDNFFDLGGDSILSLQIVARARQAGLALTARQVFEQQTVAQLAASSVEILAADATTHTDTVADQNVPFPLLPIQARFFEQQSGARHHWNQSVLLASSEAPDLDHLDQALVALVDHHDALRLRFEQKDGRWMQHHAATENALLLSIKRNVPNDVITQHSDALQRALDITAGPLIRALAMELIDGTWRLFIVIHHLAVDAVSWRILLDDLQTACDQLARGEAIDLPPRTTSYQSFARQLQAAAAAQPVRAELTYWTALAQVPSRIAARQHAAQAEPCRATIRMDRASTRRFMQDTSNAYRTRINDLLLVALGRTLCRFAGLETLRVDLEGHGRETHFAGADLSRTVGWYTSLYPVRLDPQGALPDAIKRVKETLRAVPNAGLGFGLLKHLGAPEDRVALAGVTDADVVFNYLGQFDSSFTTASRWQPATEATGASQSEDAAISHALEVSGQVFDGELAMTFLHRRGDYLDASTLDSLARQFNEDLREVIDHCTSGASGLTPSDVPLAFLDQAQLDVLPPRANDIADVYPLAPMQAGIVFHSLLGEITEAYINQLRVDIDGLDVTRFRQAWETVVARHDVLRTGFLQFDDAPRQWVARHVTLPYIEEDWRTKPQPADALERFAAAQRAQGFDITRPPLMRVALLRTSDARHHFVWTFHHALLDGWSMAQLLAEVLKRYDGATFDTPCARYRDFIAWLAQREASDGAASEAYWRAQMGGITGPTLLTRVLPEPSESAQSTGSPKLHESFGDYTVRCDHARTARLADFARRNRVTLNTLVQAAWLLLLQRYTGQRSVSFGATVSGRPEALADAQRTLGLFINTIPVVAAPEASFTVVDWLARVQQQNLASREHDHVPLYNIQRWAGLVAAQSLFDSIVVFENYPLDEVLTSSAERDLRFSNLQSREETHYPLTLSVIQRDTLQLDFSYARDACGAMQIKQIGDHLSALLDAFAADPGRVLANVPMLSADELARLDQWGHPQEKLLDATPVHRRIATQARMQASKQALVLGNESIDYGTLERRANGVAQRLIERGIGAESRVGIAVDRSIGMIAALLGVLKAGAAYVPLDPSYPAERIAYMIEDSRIELALIDGEGAAALANAGVHTLDLLMCGMSDNPPDVDVHPATLAYVIYTSGSTGRPKGVGIAHHALARHTSASIDLFGLTHDDRVLQFSTFNFDAFVEQIFPSLCHGCTVFLRGPEFWSSERFLAEVASSGITVTDFTTSYWNALAQDFALDPHAARSLVTLRRVHAGGEAMPADGVRAWRAAGLGHVELLNTYGPSEATVTATAFDCAPYLRAEAPIPPRIPLGAPLAGRSLAVVDAHFNRVPPGVAGELCIGGSLLARGYLHRAGLTAERFIADPFASEPGGRLYRTGDLVRWNEQGGLDYLGRIDDQVKVRGFRVELGEIEAQLLQLPEVRAAAAVAREGAGGLRLIAYAVLNAPAASGSDGTALRARLASVLPDYMVPSMVVVLETMPLNPSGKLDHHALSLPAADDRAGAFEPPQGEMERALAEIWSRVLGAGEVGRNDSFFELGGHSLAAMQVQAALRRTLSIDAALGNLMTNQPLHRLASQLDEIGQASHDEALSDMSAMQDILAQL